MKVWHYFALIIGGSTFVALTMDRQIVMAFSGFWFLVVTAYAIGRFKKLNEQTEETNQDVN